MRVSDFNFDLPEELIAQKPPEVRGSSRMLVVDRKTLYCTDNFFRNLPNLLQPNDLLILNDSRVIPARLYATRAGLHTQPNSPDPTGRIEVLLTQQLAEDEWSALVRPGRKVQPGERLLFHAPNEPKPLLEAEILTAGEFGERTLRFDPTLDFTSILNKIGHMPLPPYIHRDDTAEDRERYQTIYSQQSGSAAAPSCWPALHSGDPQSTETKWDNGRNHHPARRPRNLSTRSSRKPRRHPPPRRALHPSTHHCRSYQYRENSGESHYRGRHHNHTNPGTLRPRRRWRTSKTALWPNRYLPQPRPQIRHRQWPSHQLSPPAIHPSHAGQRLRRQGDGISRLRPRGPTEIPLFQLRRLHASPLTSSRTSLPRATIKTPMTPKSDSSSTLQTKPPIYLLDSMAFIFRAYHAMQRSRPMSTRTGIPTAATYVFVNMINKLRKDFQPQYLAAVYDVGAPVHRNELATQFKDVKKFNIKTQQFETTEYGGYKANRTETPPDLIQQQPYIRRALEAFRIPILYYEGFEADDVIGTLSCKLAALGHKVFVVSSDKDMMQLVNKDVSILNPTKDNLILDPAGVEATLGVPPGRVIDVMALRGDSVDNIPGAPGIGDKGSVELIQQFGTVEAALNQADEVKKKTYRESLQNNRNNILLSKELVTIHTNVPIEYSLDAMRTQPPDLAACRALFSELEFTTLLKELSPAPDNTVTTYNLKPASKEIAALLKEARALDESTGKPKGLAIAIFEDARAIA